MKALRVAKPPSKAFGDAAAGALPGVLLVAVEAGVPSVHVAVALGEREQFAVVAQGPAEANLEIVPRAIRRLDALERDGKTVARAVLLMNRASSDSATGARRLVLNALIRHAARAGGHAEILLNGPLDAGEDYRAKVLAMEKLFSARCAHEGAPVRIRVRFQLPLVNPVTHARPQAMTPAIGQPAA